MSGTYVVIGHPIAPAGVILSPSTIIATGGVWLFATSAPIPIASLSGGAAEASALIGIGNATAIG